MAIRERILASLTVFAVAGGLLAGGAPGAQAATTTPAQPVLNASNTGVALVAGNSGVHQISAAQYQATTTAAGAVVASGAAAEILVKSSGVAAPAAAAATQCWTYTDWRSENNVLGMQLWKLNVQLNWCASGGYFTSANTNTWGDTGGLGWVYKGLSQGYQRYGIGWNEWEVVRQGHFCLASYFDCVQNFYPYMDVIVGPAGQIYNN